MRKIILATLATLAVTPAFSKPDNKKKMQGLEKAFFACVKECNAAKGEKACNDEVDAMETNLRKIGQAAQKAKIAANNADVKAFQEQMKGTCPNAHKAHKGKI